MIHRAYNKFLALKPKNGVKLKKCCVTTQQLCLSAIISHFFLLRTLNFVLTVRSNILWTVGHACCTAASEVRPSITRLMANQWPETHTNVQYKGLLPPLCPPLQHFIFIYKPIYKTLQWLLTCYECTMWYIVVYVYHLWSGISLGDDITYSIYQAKYYKVICFKLLCVRHAMLWRVLWQLWWNADWWNETETVCLHLKVELYRCWESFETLWSCCLLELRHAAPCLSRVSGLTGLMTVRLWGALSLPQLNSNTREHVSRSDVCSDLT